MAEYSSQLQFCHCFIFCFQCMFPSFRQIEELKVPSTAHQYRFGGTSFNIIFIRTFTRTMLGLEFISLCCMLGLQPVKIKALVYSFITISQLFFDHRQSKNIRVSPSSPTWIRINYNYDGVGIIQCSGGVMDKDLIFSAQQKNLGQLQRGDEL